MKKSIRLDAIKYMWPVIFANIFANAFTILLPAIAAFYIGDMTDFLLAMDLEKIRQSMPGFLFALVLSVIGVPLFIYWKYAYMAKKGFEYDGYMVSRFFNMDLKNIEKNDFGMIVDRVSGDFGDYSWNIVIRYSTPVALCIYAIWIFFTYYRKVEVNLFIILVLIVPGISVLKGYYFGNKNKTVKKIVSEYADARRNEESVLYNARKHLNQLGLEKKELDNFETLFQNYMKHGCKQKNLLEIVQLMFDYLVDVILIMLLLFVGGVFVCKGTISIGLLMSGYLLLPSVTEFYKLLISFIEEHKLIDFFCDRLQIFYGTKEHLQPIENQSVDELMVKHAAFSYDGEKQVLKDVSFSFHEGNKYLILGKNGSGKSTLYSIISGLYGCDEGSVVTLPNSVHHFEQLRDVVSYQEQNGAIFGGTVNDNLFISENEKEKAKELLLKFGFLKGLEYLIEPEGMNLSPGEKKKILIIRTLLKKANFYIFDEPLNHLDSVGTDAFLMEVNKLEGGVIVSSHQSQIFSDWIKYELIN